LLLEIHDQRVDLAEEGAEESAEEERVTEKIVNYIFSNYNI
jgi:hypothetical protein